jgi:hypothetical protein
VFNGRTMPALVLLLFLLVSAGCTHAANWSWRQPPRVATVALPAPPSPRPSSALADAGSRRPMPPGPPSYRYEARFEPPDGRILHGMGQWPDGNDDYLAALGDPALEPAASLCFLAIGDWIRPWESQIERLRSQLLAEAGLGRVLHLGIGLKGLDQETGAEIPVDVEVARSDEHDDHIRDLARVVRDVGVPSFVRIGFEFSGSWNGYTPVDYPRAFRHVVELFREEHADNAAFVWCWEASAPGDFDSHEQDAWRWYPGDDVVDWFGLDLFRPEAFIACAPGARSTMHINSLRFLDMAEKYGKPVMVAESSAVTVGITPDEQDGRRDWAAWFEPFFAFLAEHPGIKAFHYCNTDWTQSESAQANGWLDSDILHNAFLAARYAQELRDPLYLHKADLHLLRGWPADVVPPALESPTVRAPSTGAPPR